MDRDEKINLLRAKLQALYAKGLEKGYWKDPDLADVGHAMRGLGIVNDPTQGGAVVVRRGKRGGVLDAAGVEDPTTTPGFAPEHTPKQATPDPGLWGVLKESFSQPLSERHRGQAVKTGSRVKDFLANLPDPYEAFSDAVTGIPRGLIQGGTQFAGTVEAIDKIDTALEKLRKEKPADADEKENIAWETEALKASRRNLVKRGWNTLGQGIIPFYDPIKTGIQHGAGAGIKALGHEAYQNPFSVALQGLAAYGLARGVGNAASRAGEAIGDVAGRAPALDALAETLLRRRAARAGQADPYAYERRYQGSKAADAAQAAARAARFRQSTGAPETPQPVTEDYTPVEGRGLQVSGSPAPAGLIESAPVPAPFEATPLDNAAAMVETETPPTGNGTLAPAPGGTPAPEVGPPAPAPPLAPGLAGTQVGQYNQGIGEETNAAHQEMQQVGHQQEHLGNDEGGPPAEPIGRGGAEQPAESVQGQEAGQVAGQVERPPLAAGPVGRAGVVFTPSAGTPVQTRFRVVEADDLIPSHTDALTANPAYDQRLQPRDRGRAASAEQVHAMAKSLAPERLADSPTTADGAPIIGPDGQVESGNGRTLAIRRAYGEGGESAARYRGYITENAPDFGLSPAQVQGFRRPVLVRERISPVSEADRPALAAEMGSSSVAPMGAVETARADAARLLSSGGALEQFQPGAEVTSTANQGFARAFAESLPPQERGALYQADGSLSADGARRITGALLAAAYDDPASLARLLESTDDEARALGKILLETAPTVARFKQMQATGDRYPLDISPDIAGSISTLARLRAERTPVKDYLAQQGLFGQSLSPAGQEILDFADRNARRPRLVGDLIRNYYKAADLAGDPKQGGLFGGEAPTVDTVLSAARTLTEEQGGKSKSEARAQQTGLDLQAAPPRGPAADAAAAPAGGPESGAGGAEPAVAPGPEPGVSGPRLVQGLTPDEYAKWEYLSNRPRETPGQRQRYEALSAKRNAWLDAQRGAQPAGASGGGGVSPPPGAPVAGFTGGGGGSPAPASPSSSPVARAIGQSVNSLSDWLRDALIGNFHALLRYGGPDTVLAARELGSWQAQVATAVNGTIAQIDKAAGNGFNFENFFKALVESRLRGLYERWSRAADTAENGKPDEVFSVLTRPLPGGGTYKVTRLAPDMRFLVERLANTDKFPDDIAAQAEKIAEAVAKDPAKEKDLRNLLTQTFAQARDNVPAFSHAEYDQSVSAPWFSKALDFYKAGLEEMMRASHAENDGTFSADLGPLDTYFPLTPVDPSGDVAQPSGMKGVRLPLSRPENLRNKFATGQGDAYAPDIEHLRSALGNLLRRNAQANLMRLLARDGLLLPESDPAVFVSTVRQGNRDVPVAHIAMPGGDTLPARKVEVRGSMLVYNKNGPPGNKQVEIPADTRYVPGIVLHELAPIFDRSFEWGSSYEERSPLTKAADFGGHVGLMGALDFAVHSSNLMNQLLIDTPLIGVDPGVKALSAVPLFRKAAAVAAMGKANPLANPAYTQQLAVMARLGIVPPRYGSETLSFRKASVSGTRRGHNLGTLLYDPEGIDIRARVVHFQQAMAMNGLDPDQPFPLNPDGSYPDPDLALKVARFAEHLGQYNRALAPDLVRFLKDHRINPIATAGSTFVRNSLRYPAQSVPGLSHHFLPLGKHLSRAQRVKLGVQWQLTAGVAGLVAFWAWTHKAYTGKWPWEFEGSQLLAYPLPAWANNTWFGKNVLRLKPGEQGYLSLGFANGMALRAARATGVRGYYNARMAGATPGEAQEEATKDTLNAFLHIGVAGPLFHATWEAANLKDTFVTGLRDPITGKPGNEFRSLGTDFAPGWKGQGLARAEAFLTGINSFYGSGLGSFGIGPHAQEMEGLDPLGKGLRTGLDLLAPGAIGYPADLERLQEKYARIARPYTPLAQDKKWIVEQTLTRWDETRQKKGLPPADTHTKERWQRIINGRLSAIEKKQGPQAIHAGRLRMEDALKGK